MATGFVMLTLVCAISMEFLQLSRRRSSLRNVPSGEEGETDVFAGYSFTNWKFAFVYDSWLFHFVL